MTTAGLSPHPSAPTLDQDLFRAVAGNWATGVAVVTTIDAARNPYGLTANSVTSLSLSPQQYLVCVDRRAASLPALLESRLFCINILSEDQDAVARVFASKQPDKFQGLAWRRLPTGLPVIEGTLAQIGCEVVAIHEGGDHLIVAGQVTHLGLGSGRPLLYFRGAFQRLT